MLQRRKGFLSTLDLPVRQLRKVAPMWSFYTTMGIIDNIYMPPSNWIFKIMLSLLVLL